MEDASRLPPPTSLLLLGWLRTGRRQPLPAGYVNIFTHVAPHWTSPVSSWSSLSLTPPRIHKYFPYSSFNDTSVPVT